MNCPKHNCKMIQLFSSWACDVCDGKANTKSSCLKLKGVPVFGYAKIHYLDVNGNTKLVNEIDRISYDISKSVEDVLKDNRKFSEMALEITSSMYKSTYIGEVTIEANSWNDFKKIFDIDKD